MPGVAAADEKVVDVGAVDLQRSDQAAVAVAFGPVDGDTSVQHQGFESALRFPALGLAQLRRVDIGKADLGEWLMVYGKNLKPSLSCAVNDTGDRARV